MGDAMNRFALAALMTVTVFDSANALMYQFNRYPECQADAVKFCNAVISDVDKRRACMRAHYSKLSPECIAALKR
jgi:hypothetical protein